MREMKDSGIEWVGTIPNDWKTGRIGGLYSLRNTKVSDKDYPPLSVTMKGIVPQLDTAAKTNAHDDRKLVKKGDFAINSRSDRRGSCGISDYDGSVSLINTVLTPRGKMVPGYYNWLFHTTNFGDEFYKWGHGIVDDLWSTNWQDMKKIIIPIPPLKEQESISAYLDSRCSEIDILSTEIQSEIDTLEEYKKSVITEVVTKGLNPNAKMKDSGIQWIGNMPSHWNCIRGKYFLKYLQKPIRDDDGIITCFRDGEVTLRSNRREEGFTMADKEIGYQGIDIGDLVVHGMDGFAGAIGISDSRGKASPVLNVLDTDQNKRYIMYYLRSMAYSNVFVALATGIRVRSCDLRWNKLSELFYPIPPIDEQNAIAFFIDEKLAKVDILIDEKKKQLATLAEYKKSLIYEYVTGKKEVPEEGTNTIVALEPRMMLLGTIIDKLGKNQKGRIQLQKILYLADMHLGLNRDIQYYRYDHGPYDIHLNDYIDKMVKNGWYQHRNQGGALLVAGKNHADFLRNAKNMFGDKETEIGNLLNLLQSMNVLKRTRMERIATLYAAWNDFLLEGITPTDDQIIQEVMTNWTENKGNTKYETWQDSLNKMKTNGLIPKGVGLHTLPKPQKEVADNE